LQPFFNAVDFTTGRAIGKEKYRTQYDYYNEGKSGQKPED
jgi:hypothetical protein